MQQVIELIVHVLSSSSAGLCVVIDVGKAGQKGLHVMEALTNDAFGADEQQQRPGLGPGRFKRV
ncbi:hypothetical protein PspR76_01060 [Pseudomonas sp. R76]|nr:hypothetical protein PspR76_01060 [Pseudomonas sp. R76]